MIVTTYRTIPVLNEDSVGELEPVQPKAEGPWQLVDVKTAVDVGRAGIIVWHWSKVPQASAVAQDFFDIFQRRGR